MAEDWRKKAACLTVDPDSMFPDPSDRDGILRARAVCNRCKVGTDCEEAAQDEEYGVWNGRLREKRYRLTGIRR